MKHITATILRRLRHPRPSSHKGENGVLYIAAGSRQYHGSLWYAVETAAHFVDLIYVETAASNAALVQALKKLHPAIILVPKKQRAQYLAKSDCLLIGPGLGRTHSAKKLVAALMRHPHRPTKVVIDADALYYMRFTWLTADMVLTPHRGEFQALFGKKTVAAASQHLPCVILRKGPRDEICQNNKCSYNTVGNVGLTKGGTGDSLAGLIAAFACVNPVWAATQAATLLVGLAANQLAKTHGPHFTTRELIHQIPLTLHQWHHQTAQTPRQKPRRKPRQKKD